jgi:hypothetical protein
MRLAASDTAARSIRREALISSAATGVAFTSPVRQPRTSVPYPSDFPPGSAVCIAGTPPFASSGCPVSSTSAEFAHPWFACRLGPQESWSRSKQKVERLHRSVRRFRCGPQPVGPGSDLYQRSSFPFVGPSCSASAAHRVSSNLNHSGGTTRSSGEGACHRAARFVGTGRPYLSSVRCKFPVWATRALQVAAELATCYWHQPATAGVRVRR